jgi:hypothetical protein
MPDAEKAYKLLHEKNSVQRKLARLTFEFWQRLGFHLVGDHFYDPIPNTKTIEITYNQDLRELPGLSVYWSAFVPEACTLMELYLEEFISNRHIFGYREDNYYFYGLDALYYYSFIRKWQPKRIVEIGQGFSTRIALAALTQNASAQQNNPRLVSIDPYPRLELEVPKAIEYVAIRKSLRDLNEDLSKTVRSGDLLFIDSSHVFKFGSDVQLLFEYVYPRLAIGAFLHVHDIFTPYDYPRDWMLKRKQFWNEQYFLESFLSFNEDFRIEAPIHYIVREGSADHMLCQRNYGPEVIRREGASLYLRRASASESRLVGAT